MLTKKKKLGRPRLTEAQKAKRKRDRLRNEKLEKKKALSNSPEKQTDNNEAEKDIEQVEETYYPSNDNKQSVIESVSNPSVTPFFEGEVTEGTRTLRGTNKDPILVSKEFEIERNIIQFFGHNYFIISEQTLPVKGNKKLRVYYIEKDGGNYSVWFDVTPLAVF